jgi:hypothetical protein
VGTIGGQSPSFTRERMMARAGLVRDDRRVKPPLSRTSTSAGLTEASLANSAGDGVGVGTLAGGGFAHLGGEFVEIGGGFVERILAFELGTKSDLQELGRRESASLQLIVKIIR